MSWFQLVNLCQSSHKTYAAVLNWSSCWLFQTLLCFRTTLLSTRLSTLNLLIYLTVRYTYLINNLTVVGPFYFATLLLYCVKNKQTNKKKQQQKAQFETRHHSLTCCVTLRSAVLCLILIHSCCCAIATHYHTLTSQTLNFIPSCHCTLLFYLFSCAVGCHSHTAIIYPITAALPFSSKVPVW